MDGFKEAATASEMPRRCSGKELEADYGRTAAAIRRAQYAREQRKTCRSSIVTAASARAGPTGKTTLDTAVAWASNRCRGRKG
jgi:hypothetical protein